MLRAFVAAGLLLGIGANPPTVPWPSGATPSHADVPGALGGNVSGLTTDGAGGLWAVRDGPGALLRLSRTPPGWAALPDWGDGRRLRYPDGRGEPDAEAVTTANESGVVFVGAERDNTVPTTSRNSILRYETSGTSAIDATQEWRLDAVLPPTEANNGVEGLTWVPDEVLAAAGFLTTQGVSFKPTADHEYGGLFVVGVEATGDLHLVGLRSDGGVDLVGTVSSGLDAVMEVVWLPDRQELWALCDNTCAGRFAIFGFAGGGLVLQRYADPPLELTRLNNEGFAMVPGCDAATAVAVWSDDAATDGHALREVPVPCQAPTEREPRFDEPSDAAPQPPPTPSVDTVSLEPTTIDTAEPAAVSPAATETELAAEPRPEASSRRWRWWYLGLTSAGVGAALAVRARRRSR